MNGNYIGVRPKRGGSSSDPVNTIAPVVSGTTTVGETLSCTTGTWTGSPTFTYQWQKGGVDIRGATNNNYILLWQDIGYAIRCVVTGTNGSGNSSANSNTVTPTYDADFAAWYARMSTPQSLSNNAIFNKFIIGAKTAHGGITNLSDAWEYLVVYGWPNATDSLLNAVQNLFNASFAGGMSVGDHTANGFTGDFVSKRIINNFIPATDATVITATDNHAGSLVQQWNGADNYGIQSGGETANEITVEVTAPATDDDFYGSSSSPFAGPFLNLLAGKTTRVLVGVSRGNGLNFDAIVDTVATNEVGVSTSLAPTNSMRNFCRWNNADFSKATIFATWVCKKSTLNLATWNTVMQELLTDLGIT